MQRDKVIEKLSNLKPKFPHLGEVFIQLTFKSRFGHRIRFLIIKVKKKNTNSVLATVDSTIGSFRVPLGGLRQNKTVDNWYVITKPPGIGKVRLKLTYKCTLPMHNTKGNSGKKKARLLVHTPPYMYEYLPVGKTDQLYTKHIFDIQKNDEQKNSNIETNGEEEKIMQNI